jgi:hypothetical protein
MTRKLKVVAVALAALFAVSAISAQAAFAEEEFHAHAKHVVLTGEQHPQFPAQKTTVWVGATSKGNLTCNKLELWGDSEGTETTSTLFTSKNATVHPKYAECTSTFGNLTVNTEECHFNLTATTNANGHAELHINCPTGQSIKTSIASGACVISINNEQTLTGVHYTNVTTSDTAHAELTVHLTTGKTIHYTASGFGCALAGIPTSGTEAEWEGTWTLKAFKYVSGSTTAPSNSYKDEEQVGIFKE